MSAKNPQQPSDNPQTNSPGKKVQDLPGCIKYILLIFLILLLLAEIYAGEFGRLRDFGAAWNSWVILIIKLLLIIGILILIWVQKQLKCQITSPTGCTEEERDEAAGRLFVRVNGTASGSVFGHYTLDVRRDGDPPLAGVVTYPPAGNGVPVVNGELGQIKTTLLPDGAYDVILTVYSTGANSKQCTASFNLLKIMVFISKVGKIQVISNSPTPDNANPLDPAAELRKDFAPPPLPDYQLVSVGGNLSIEGDAYIYECASRKIKDYQIRWRKLAPADVVTEPAADNPIPADWPVGQRIVLLEYAIPDHYNVFTRVGMAPRDLVNSFKSVTIGGNTIYTLKSAQWESGGLSGRLSLLLTATDTTAGPHIYHDIQNIWLDNKQPLALISGIENVKPCAELTLSQFVGSGMTVLGIAWDALIDDAFLDTAPNDNFDSYTITLYKQGGGSHTVSTSGTRVPARKTGAEPVVSPPASVVEAGSLANFDIVSVIDEGTPGFDPAVSIPRSTGCAYYLYLTVTDKTRVSDDSGTHLATSIWPFCITNDIK